MNLTIEDQLIFSSLKSYFNKNEVLLSDFTTNSEYNWDLFTESVIRNGVSPFFYKNIIQLNSELFPSKVKTKFEATYFKTLSRNILLYEQFNKIITEFSTKNISVIVLKGIFLANHIYQDIGQRQLSDIDLLLKYEDIETAGNILMQLGFENLNRKLKKDFHQSKHFNFQKDGIIIELHQHIYHHTESFKVDINKYWSNAQPTIINGINTLTLNEIDLIQQLCIHLYIHLRIGKFSLISFCDIIIYIKTKQSEFDWNQFLKKCEQENCLKEVSIILLISQKYCGEFIPKSTLANIYGYSNIFFEERFIAIFHGNNMQINVDEEKINAFNESKGIINKFKYLMNDVFQIKEFMIYRYKPKYPKLYFLYYPIRLFTRISKYVMFVKRKTN